MAARKTLHSLLQNSPASDAQVTSRQLRHVNHDATGLPTQPQNECLVCGMRLRLETAPYGTNVRFAVRPIRQTITRGAAQVQTAGRTESQVAPLALPTDDFRSQKSQTAYHKRSY